MKLPRARTEDLLEQNLKNETLIYDLTIDKAFNLNETLSVVYRACGENLTFDELKHRSKFTNDFIYLALDELKRENLLAEDYISPFAATNRREVIKKVGLATMFALPLITGLAAPRAISAASNQGSNPPAAQQPYLNDSCTTFSPPNSPPPPWCVASSCLRTTSGIERCCNNGDGTIIASGDTVVVTTGSDETMPTYTIITPNSPPPTCSDFYKCCDASRALSGSCTYEEIGRNGDDILARVACTCSC